MINSRVICRNHAKELQFRALCWNLNVPYNIYSANESYELLSCAYHLDRLQEWGAFLVYEILHIQNKSVSLGF